MHRMIILCVVMASGAATALAGTKGPQPVVVGASNAYGSIGSARNSPDGWQLIGCYATVYLTPNQPRYAGCYARDASGHFAACYSYNPSIELTQIVLSVSDSSYVSFSWNASSECTQITVYNTSAFEPKAP